MFGFDDIKFVFVNFDKRFRNLGINLKALNFEGMGREGRRAVAVCFAGSFFRLRLRLLTWRRLG